jgi:ribosomal protein S18 acetylase RimI-like enzyme
MIRELTQDEVVETFFDLMIQIESGDKFDKTNSCHVNWLNRKISRRFGCGARFYGHFLEDSTPTGLVGVVIEDHPMLAGYSEVLDLGVFKEFRTNGIGGELMEYAEELSRKASVYCVYVSTYSADTKLVAYYGKRGYVPVATHPDVHGPNGEGQVYMRKKL